MNIQNPSQTAPKGATDKSNIKESKNQDHNHLVFGKKNYILLIVSILIVVFGFILMSGDTDIYSTMKITIAPIIILIGFGLGVYAIIKQPTIS